MTIKFGLLKENLNKKFLKRNFSANTINLSYDYFTYRNSDLSYEFLLAKCIWMVWEEMANISFMIIVYNYTYLFYTMFEWSYCGQGKHQGIFTRSFLVIKFQFFQNHFL